MKNFWEEVALSFAPRHNSKVSVFFFFFFFRFFLSRFPLFVRSFCSGHPEGSKCTRIPLHVSGNGHVRRSAKQHDPKAGIKGLFLLFEGNRARLVRLCPPPLPLASPCQSGDKNTSGHDSNIVGQARTTDE